ncbi:hypothetical protein GLA29479_654 [Lysobacter antibioticus]|uniref:hypothetical protein n=1 Tax=Lysobacter antibioticus TaxID=84531 RepID=UPI00071FC466|nr:hypothetical protein [Lysobacter antibioticus]ALN61539.1 hypothetical protein GLA29479_654 [Lysobacter antibioticus]
MTMDDVTTNVVANVIAWPVIIALGYGATRSWRLFKLFDETEAQQVKNNTSYRTAASARAVSDVVIGCSSILAGLVFLFVDIFMRIVDIQLDLAAMHQRQIAILTEHVLALGSKKIDLKELPDPVNFADSSAIYLALMLFAIGAFYVFLGRRLLSHLTRATLK